MRTSGVVIFRAWALVSSKVDGFVPHAQNVNLRIVGRLQCERVKECYNPPTSAIFWYGCPRFVPLGLGHQLSMPRKILGLTASREESLHLAILKVHTSNIHVGPYGRKSLGTCGS